MSAFAIMHQRRRITTEMRLSVLIKFQLDQYPPFSGPTLRLSGDLVATLCAGDLVEFCFAERVG